jgi:uncharacterized membrane protein YgcG
MRLLALLGLIWGLASPQLEAKSFYYRSITVDARLDGEGLLHISERQEMVFTGDWNGGERIFRTRYGHRLGLRQISRIDETGTHLLREGDLSRVDTFKWTDSNTLRWRSRMPDDPPFNETEITYVLDYTMANVLLAREQGYLLDHDFAFPERQGDIQRFALSLRFDPPWKTTAPEIHADTGPLRPGMGYVVTVPLEFEAAGKPSALLTGASPDMRFVLFCLIVCVPAAGLWSLYVREHSLGRFARLVPAASIDEPWLRENILCHLPEVVGAAWDDTTGAPEVAAVLARLVSEKKLRSDVRRGTGMFGSNVLHLTLLVERDTLPDYERKLIRALFFDDGSETDTESIRKHYKSQGFDPAAKIRDGLKSRTDKLGGNGDALPNPSWRPGLLLFLGGIACLAIAGFLRPFELIVVGIAAAIGLPLYIWAMVAAYIWRKRISGLVRGSIWFLLPVVGLLWGMSWLTLSGAYYASALLLTGCTLTALAAAHSVMNEARCRQGASRIALRKKFASAREYFRAELRKPEPRLQDGWFPYLMAFGLGKHVDRWFKSYGGVSSVSTSPGGQDWHSSSGGVSAGSSAWTGGGGAFGGAGASGTWAVAAGSLAAGVASSSSGSGSGGGGGGGSSGGGGGGAW